MKFILLVCAATAVALLPACKKSTDADAAPDVDGGTALPTEPLPWEGWMGFDPGDGRFMIAFPGKQEWTTSQLIYREGAIEIPVTVTIARYALPSDGFIQVDFLPMPHELIVDHRLRRSAVDLLLEKYGRMRGTAGTASGGAFFDKRHWRKLQFVSNAGKVKIGYGTTVADTVVVIGAEFSETQRRTAEQSLGSFRSDLPSLPLD